MVLVGCSPGRCAAHNTPSVVRYSTGQFPDSHTHTRAAAGQRGEGSLQGHTGKPLVTHAHLRGGRLVWAGCVVAAPGRLQSGLLPAAAFPPASFLPQKHHMDDRFGMDAPEPRPPGGEGGLLPSLLPLSQCGGPPRARRAGRAGGRLGGTLPVRAASSRGSVGRSHTTTLPEEKLSPFVCLALPGGPPTSAASGSGWLVEHANCNTQADPGAAGPGGPALPRCLTERREREKTGLPVSPAPAGRPARACCCLARGLFAVGQFPLGPACLACCLCSPGKGVCLCDAWSRIQT